MTTLLLLAACTGAAPPPPPGTTDTGATDTGTDDSADTPDTGDTAIDPPDGVTLGPVQACDAPLDSVRYTESGATLGLSPHTNLDGEHLNGGAVAVDDFDDDGDLDVALVYGEGHVLLHWREPAGFTVETLEITRAAQLSLADVDADGREDLIVAGFFPQVFLRRDDGWETHDLTYPLFQGGAEELTPADLDGDGHVDLFATATGPSKETADKWDFVYRGDGTGDFTAVTDAVEEAAGSRAAFDAVILDADLDTVPDVYVVNDKGPEFGPNVLWMNQGGTLVDGSADCHCDLTHSGMGGDVADVNGDGRPDLYVTAAGSNSLLESLADGTFVDVAEAVGADPLIRGEVKMGWGAIWLDHDNDGEQDILAAYGDLNSYDGFGFWDELPFLLLRGQDGRFTDVSETHGFPTEGSWRGLVAADHNGDGVLDLLIKEATDQPMLYLSDGCTANTWLVVEAPLHSRVEVVAGDRTWTDWVNTDQSFAGFGPQEIWFGLGDRPRVDLVRVVLPWNGGVIEIPGPVDTRRRIHVSAP